MSGRIEDMYGKGARKMKKKIFAMLFVGMTLIMTGCGNAIPDMTDEQLQTVGEYTAMLLLSHDVNYKSRLVDVESLPTAESLDSSGDETLATPTPIPEETPAPENVGMDPTEDTPIVDLTDGQNGGVQETLSLEEILDLPGQLVLSYTGYEIADSYPQDASEAEYFTVDAENGKQLLVLHFNLQNPGEGTENVYIKGQSLVIKVSVNGITSNSLATLLENDLAYYQGSVNPGESRETVILVEYDAQALRDVASVEINVKNGEKNTTIRLE